MATEKQIAANRANSKRSTGPKTGIGRIKSGRNAFRHGLSLPADAAEIETLTGAFAEGFSIAGGGAPELLAVRQLAMAHFELLRVRRVRERLLASLDCRDCRPRDLRRLIALTRYERIALAKRRKAACEF
jgi:hypothetical protein